MNSIDLLKEASDRLHSAILLVEVGGDNEEWREVTRKMRNTLTRIGTYLRQMHPEQK